LTQWIHGTLFTFYAWNASPVDGTDIIQSFAAKGCAFPFPIDLDDTIPPIPSGEGQAALEHMSSTFPLLFKQ
jgi:hypothetical protein